MGKLYTFKHGHVSGPPCIAVMLAERHCL